MGEMRWRSTTWVLVMLTTAGAVAWTARTTGVMRGLESGTGAAAGAVAVQSRARQARVPAARRRPGNRENDGCMVNSVIVADGKKDGKAQGAGERQPWTDGGDALLLSGRAVGHAGIPGRIRLF